MIIAGSVSNDQAKERYPDGWDEQALHPDRPDPRLIELLAVAQPLALRLGDVDHPGDAEAVDDHAEDVAPFVLLERQGDLAALGELVPGCGSSASSSPERLIEIVPPGWWGMPGGVSEAISVKPAGVSS